MVLLIGEAQQVIHFILYNAVQDHDPGPACELLSIGGWVCGQGDRGAHRHLRDLIQHGRAVHSRFGILCIHRVAGARGQVTVVVDRIVGHKIGLALCILIVADKVQLFLPGRIRRGDLARGGNGAVCHLYGRSVGKGIFDGNVLSCFQINIVLVILESRIF